jgi:hypothetical protein
MALLKPIAAIAALSVALLYVVGESTSNEDSSVTNQARPDVDFEVTKDESDRYKRSVEVLLPDRISEQQLAEVAAYLHQGREGNTFIGYYIEGEADYAYWATTHYDPEMTVRIIGSNQSQEQALSNSAESEGAEVLGRWRVSRGYNSIITITETDGEKRLIQRFQDGSKMDNPIQERVVNGQVRISDGIGENNGEYYVIGSDGRLQFWSDSGNYYTAPIHR